MTVKHWLVGLAGIALVIAGGCRPRTTSRYYRAQPTVVGYTPIAAQTPCYPAPAAPCSPAVTPVPPPYVP